MILKVINAAVVVLATALIEANAINDNLRNLRKYEGLSGLWGWIVLHTFYEVNNPAKLR